MNIIQIFIDSYNPDGACDEGPGYWSSAGGALFDCLDALHEASGGAVNFWDEPLIREIGRYIMKAHIDDYYFVNFADCPAKCGIDRIHLWRYGRRLNDAELMKFARSFQKDKEKFEFNGAISLRRFLPSLFLEKIFEDYEVQNAPFVFRDSWFPDTQIMYVRESGENAGGLYIAAKGGHNNESHNHNDVGSFIVYYNGYPAIIDTGAETYTKKTFSAQRYEIWTMQSCYHNTPIINGFSQSPGREYKAKDVKYIFSENQVEFSMEISGAYPYKCGSEIYQRNWIFFRGKSAYIELTDNFKFRDNPGTVSLVFMVWKKPVLYCDGGIKIFCRENETLIMNYDSTLMEASIEECDSTNENLRWMWGDTVYRLLLKMNDPVSEGKIKVRIKAE